MIVFIVLTITFLFARAAEVTVPGRVALARCLTNTSINNINTPPPPPPQFLFKGPYKAHRYTLRNKIPFLYASTHKEPLWASYGFIFSKTGTYK